MELSLYAESRGTARSKCDPGNPGGVINGRIVRATVLGFGFNMLTNTARHFASTPHPRVIPPSPVLVSCFQLSNGAIPVFSRKPVFGAPVWVPAAGLFLGAPGATSEDLHISPSIAYCSHPPPFDKRLSW